MARKPRQDFPTHQLIVLSICRFVEPVAFTSIFPYIYYMVEHFKVTKNDSEIAMWTGGAVAAFAFAEMLSGMLWGNLSDRIGRKPVLICGLAGTGLSMLCFGLAPSMPLALLARALGGLLNGNVGVIQTTVAELVPNKEHQPRAFSVMPIVWSIGSIVGPTIGGLLAEPVTSYPEWFAKGGLFDKYPYLLPNIGCVVICIIGVVNGILFLDETHSEMGDEPDRGRKIGLWIQGLLFGNNRDAELSTTHATETTPLLINTDSGADTESDANTATPINAVSRTSSKPSTPPKSPKSKGFVKTWTPQVIHNVIAYGIIAFHTIAFDQLLGVFLQSPPESTKLSSIVKFTGGFGLSTKTMGYLYSYQGLFSMAFNFLFFAPIVRRFGNIRTFRTIAIAYPIVMTLVPYIAFLPHDNDNLLFGVIYGMLTVKTIMACLIYPLNGILLTNSAPSLLVLGTINGVAGSLASCMRAIAPVGMGWLFSRGVDMGYMGMSWWINSAIALGGAIQSFYLYEDECDGKGAESEAEDGDPEDVEYVVGEDAVRNMEPGEVVVVTKAGKAGVVSGVQEVVL